MGSADLLNANDDIGARAIHTIAGALRSTDVITPDMNLEADLNVDSMMKFEVSMAIESEFGIEIPDQDVAKLVTISDIIDYVRVRVAARG